VKIPEDGEAHRATCDTGYQCAPFQNCIEGHCYSDCEGDGDCRDPQVCDRKACRVPCTVGIEGQCPPAHWCDVKEGLQGSCMPSRPARALPQARSYAPAYKTVQATASDVAISPRAVTFRQVDDVRCVTIQNTSADDLAVHTKALYHVLQTVPVDGSVPDAERVAQNPLCWVDLQWAEGAQDCADLSGAVLADVGGPMTVPSNDSLTLVLTNTDAGDCDGVRITRANADAWTGSILLSIPGVTHQSITLTHSSQIGGRFVGQMYYYANFGTTGLDQWAPPGTAQDIRAVENALVRRWWAYREGRISHVEFLRTLDATESGSWTPCALDEQNEPETACYTTIGADGQPRQVIYSDDLATNPVPTGVTQFDFAVDFTPDPAVATHRWNGRVPGSIALHYPDSPVLDLTFADDPADCWRADGRPCLTTLATDPAVPPMLISRLIGHYRIPQGDCAAGFERLQLPWLVPAFTHGMQQSGQTVWRLECLAGEEDGQKQRRALANPLATGADLRRTMTIIDGGLISSDELFLLFKEELPALFGDEVVTGYGYIRLQREPSLTARAHSPECEIDGDCRSAEHCEAERCVGRACVANEDCAAGAVCRDTHCIYDVAAPEQTCDDFVDQLTAYGVRAAGGLTADERAAWLLYGRGEQLSPQDTLDPDVWRVYYLCEATGRILTGRDVELPLSPTERLCPPESEVQYFAVHLPLTAGAELLLSDCSLEPGICQAGEPCDRGEQNLAGLDDVSGCYQPNDDEGEAGLDRDDIGNLGDDSFTADECYAETPCPVGEPCASKGNCAGALSTWMALDPTDRPFGLKTNIQYICADANRQDCDSIDDRLDGKRFFETPGDTRSPVPSFTAAKQDAFRYIDRFRSRHDGGALGFVPWPCRPGTEAFCYDVEGIYDLKARMDCAASLVVGDLQGSEDLDDELRARLVRRLQQSFGYVDESPPGALWSNYVYGFEFRFAELLIMLGDEALVNAYSARFDLAGQRVASFPGAALEVNGIDLGSTAGFEMVSLYRAQQSYQAVVDRFFELRPQLEAYLANDATTGNPLLGATTAISWFAKLAQASVGKTRVAAELAKRYQQFARPDLAREVVQRAFVATYLESIYFGQLMKGLLDETTTGAQRAQISYELKAVQLRYGQSLSKMRTAYLEISDDARQFGFAATYVPSTPLDDGDVNLYEKLFARARDKAAVAAGKEQVALGDTRDFDVDRAEFVSALTEIELDALGQIGALCGWVNVDEAVYPATREFKHLFDDPRLELFPDPCGYSGNGQIFTAIQAVADAQDDLALWRIEHANKVQAIRDEGERLSGQCARITDFADWRADRGQEQVDIVDALAGFDMALAILDRLDTTANNVSQLAAEGSGTDVVKAIGVMAVSTGYTVWTAIYHASSITMEAIKVRMAHEAAEIENVLIPYAEALQACDELQIDTQYIVRDRLRDLAEHNEEVTGLARTIKTTVGEVLTLRNLVTDTEATRTEQRQLAVDLEAARNDPNVRLYRNAAVMEADRTFDAAVKAAWQATRGFEYYTNQTYGARGDLAFVRMVAAGDTTLEAYLDGLDDAFFEFEERAGNPDLRVEVISVAEQLRPRCDDFVASDVALTVADRAEGFRCLLESTARDANARMVLDFRTDLRRLSPLTHNHKIRFIEVELVGEGLGDDLARVYLRQKGGQDLGVLRAADGRDTTYTLPQRTAVVNASFSGDRTLADAILRLDEVTGDYYRSERLRDRPLHHGGWELVLDLHNESVNRDIPIEHLEDIKVYLWYTDFTEN
jgi:hypothetical protein